MKSWLTRNLAGTLLAVATCLFLFAMPAFGADAHLFVIHNASWSTSIGAAAVSDDVKLTLSDCGYSDGSFDASTSLTRGQSTYIDDAFTALCAPPASYNGSAIGIVTFPVTTGTPRVWTEATYLDAAHNFNIVEIPALPDPLAENAGGYEFFNTESGSGKTTYLTLVTDAAGGRSTRASVTVFDASNVKVGDVLTVDVDHWNVYTLPTSVKIGRIEVRNIGPGVGPSQPSKLYAVQLVAFPAGSPQVTLPLPLATP